MAPGSAVLLVLGGSYGLLGLYLLRCAIRGVRSLEEVGEEPVPERASWPRVSVIIPACDEEERIEPALRSMLASSHPDLQVIAVDDRSTDGTGRIIDRLAGEDPRLVPVHVTSLPEGWLGKLNALQRGVERADGDWLLFADSDAHLAPQALQQAVTHGERRGLDFVSVMPRIETAGLWGDTVFALAQLILFAAVRPWRVPDPESAAVAATGAFMLVRRSAFERTPGFEWLRLEVADDFGLCLMMKSHGGRCALAGGREAVRLTWYASFGEMARRMQKNFYAISGRFSVPRMLAQASALVAFGLAPLLVLAPGPFAPPAAALGLGAGVAASVLTAHRTGRPLLASSFFFVGAILTAVIVLRAAWVGHRVGGIIWRGVRYPSAMLAAHQRLKL